jgi:protein O-GlcNAc transferase
LTTEAYQQALAVNGEDHEIWHALGICNANQKRHREAATNFRRAIQLCQSFAPAYEDLAISLAAMEAFPEAIAICKCMIALFPARAPAHLKLAAVMVLKGDLQTALSAYHHAGKLDARSASAALGMAQVLNRLGRRDQAEQWGRKAVALDEKNADAHNHLGMALAAQGKLSEAICCFQHSIELAPACADGFTNLAGGVLQCRLHRRAIELYRKAAELAPRLGRRAKQPAAGVNYPDDVDERELFAEHAKWGGRWRSPT